MNCVLGERTVLPDSLRQVYCLGITVERERETQTGRDHHKKWITSSPAQTCIWLHLLTHQTISRGARGRSQYTRISSQKSRRLSFSLRLTLLSLGLDNLYDTVLFLYCDDYCDKRALMKSRYSTGMWHSQLLVENCQLCKGTEELVVSDVSLVDAYAREFIVVQKT